MMAGDNDNKERFVTLVHTAAGFWTPAPSAPGAASTRGRSLDEIAKNLLEDVDVPLFERNG